VDGLTHRINEAGMTLAEVLVALSIFAVVGVTMVSALGTNFKVLATADQRTTAESLVKAQMEAINNSSYDSIPPYTYNKITEIPAGYDIDIAVALINPETGAVSAVDLGVQKVTVTVTCQQHSTPEVLAIESYKR
jgi:prepilin-type N-terminal cleavage/methylation domain-containing protein